MGQDFGRCVCAPDPSHDSDRNTMKKHKKNGEKERVQTSSDEEDSSDYESSSEGSTDSSSTDGEEGFTTNDESGSEEESDYQSSDDTDHHKKQRKSSNKKGGKSSIKRGDTKKRKKRKKTGNLRYTQYDDEPSDESYTGSGSENDDNQQNKRHHHHQHHQQQQQSNHGLYELKKRNSRKNLMEKKRRKEEERQQRKKALLHQKAMDKQRQSGTYSLFNNDEDATSIPVKRAQSHQQYTHYQHHPNIQFHPIQFNDAHSQHSWHDQFSDNMSVGSGSVHSSPLKTSNNNKPTLSNEPSGKHPKIESMTELDPAIIRNVQSLFDPNYRITTVDDTYYDNYNNQPSSQPISPRSANGGFSSIQPTQTMPYRQAMTPTSHQFYNRGHSGSHSMDWSYPNINFAANIPQNNHHHNHNNNNFALRRANSNPPISNNTSLGLQSRPSIDLILPQQGPTMYSNNISMNTVNIIDDVDINNEYDVDLPTTPKNPANNLNVFDISREGLDAFFKDPEEVVINESKPEEIIDNTPSSTIKPNEKENSKNSNNSQDTATAFGALYNEMHQTNLDQTNTMDTTDITPQQQQQQNNDNKQEQNDPTTNISPKEMKPSQPFNNSAISNNASISTPTEIETNLNRMAGSDLPLINPTASNILLEGIKINAQDPNAVPASPPIESVYKPLPGSVMLSRLSQITESTNEFGAHSPAPHSTPSSSVHGNIPENEIVVTTSNESIPSTQSKHVSSMEVVPEIPSNIDTAMDDNNNNLRVSDELVMQDVSSPSDDEEMVAQQWMDLHNFHNIVGVDDDDDDDGTKGARISMGNRLVSMHTDISSDQDEAEMDVKQWKKQQRVESGLSTGVLAPQSSDEDDDDDEDDVDVDDEIDGDNKLNDEINDEYSSETNQSSEYIDTETDANTPVQNENQSQLQQGHFPRHSKLLRRDSFKKWDKKEIKATVRDIQKQIEFIQIAEQDAMQKEFNKLKDKQQKSNQQQWIDINE